MDCLETWTSLMSPIERNYIQEARDILAGKSNLLPEKRHLEAIEEHYQNEIIKIVFEIDQLTKAILRRN